MTENTVPGRRVFEGIGVGEQIGATTLVFDRARLVAYAAASGDRNPIHWSDPAARAAGLPDVIAHGMLTMGAALDLVVGWAGDPSAVREYGTKFVAPVVVPATGQVEVEVAGVVRKVDEASRTVTVELAVTHDGAKVLSRALATVELR
ncbi:MaoC/PaaZ C-terminal domain-containing protein [Agilicoccus flavus]|uniref:MaoC/PaaZ C-terminal domain-containing protein n=1 Tax=Agilicoccus flavus TaxID=2775968 RepID=UPI001CF70DB5|nr:MaoC/PaaZ C-terminal domain-containing protein [Agilicoccus flavus]